MSDVLNGRLVLLKAESLDTPGTFVPVMSAKSNSFTFNHAVSDTSSKGDGRFGSILSGGGGTEMTVALEGVVKNGDDDKLMRELGWTGEAHKYEIVVLTKADGSEGVKYAGYFVATAFTHTGANKEGQTYSISLRNSGEVVKSEITAP